MQRLLSRLIYAAQFICFQIRLKLFSLFCYTLDVSTSVLGRFNDIAKQVRMPEPGTVIVQLQLRNFDKEHSNN